MRLRTYEHPADLEAVLRIHREVGWGWETPAEREVAGLYHQSGTSLLVEVDGQVESFASNLVGRLRFLEEDLPLCIVGGVATSRVARRRGLATRVTAEALARDVASKGAAVAVLGMFDQGFYDRLGFGSGPYDHLVSFDPADLRVPGTKRVPVRLGPEDWERIHRGRLAKRRPHGGLTWEAAGATRAVVLKGKDAYGLGFADAQGELTHHLWCANDPRGVPFVRWLAFRDRPQLFELLGLIRNLADQVSLVRLVEPSGLQIQDLLGRPFRRHQVSDGSTREALTRSVAWWQVRICDLESCLRQTRLPTTRDVSFNLSLSDPISAYLEPETAKRWAGVGGDWRVTLGPRSSAQRAAIDPALPTLCTSVNTFSRLWLGVARPEALALTCPDLEAPASLVADLEDVLRLPVPRIDWDI